MINELFKANANRILSMYSNADELCKALTSEWGLVHGKTKDFQRRHKVKIKEVEKPEHSRLKGDGKESADLKDKLFYSIPYRGQFYNSEGERIYLTPTELQHAKEQFGTRDGISALLPTLDEKTNKLTETARQRQIDKSAKQLKNSIIEKIEEKDKKYSEHFERKELLHSETQTEEIKRQEVDNYLQKITETTKTSEINTLLNQVQNNLSDNIDPTLIITTKNSEGKSITVKRQLDDLVKTFNSYSSVNMYSRPSIKIESIVIENFDDYTDTDFKYKKFKIQPTDHNNFYKKLK
jgi:hypothetical protein